MINTIAYGGQLFTDDRIKSADCYKAISLLSDALELDSFGAEVVSELPLGNFTRNEPLVWTHRGQRMGTFYLQSVKRLSRTSYRLEASSAIGLLEQSTHYGGIYTGQTVAEVAAEISSLPLIIKTNLQNIKLYGWLPIATRRENLSQVLFAIGASIKVDHKGTLRMDGLWDGTASELPEDLIFLGDSVEYRPTVTEVNVTEHQYVPDVMEETLFEGLATAGDIVTFSGPMHSLSAEGFGILESGANYAKLSAGNGELRGCPYIALTRVVSEGVGEAEQPNTVTVKDATLVSLANSSAVAKRLARYYAATERVEHDVVYRGELPGDLIRFLHPYNGTPVIGCLENVDLGLSGKFRAQERILLNYTPMDIGDIQYFDYAEVITKDGIWTAPTGVVSARIVLIGGGQGGSRGNNGEPASSVGVPYSGQSSVTGYTENRPVKISAHQLPRRAMFGVLCKRTLLVPVAEEPQLEPMESRDSPTAL